MENNIDLNQEISFETFKKQELKANDTKEESKLND